ncbi:MAG: biotin--[acetyl-CoA-carboxylase] ligase [Hyphomonadaceae bacterium]|nr:biotin--[acetyl-CoA-carboxylase] ligase [Clostridia bacterium]
MKDKVLSLLSQNVGDYISGQTMCSTLGVSRTTVWKTVNALKQQGIAIEAVTKRGYCLTHLPDTLNQYRIASYGDAWTAHIKVFDTVTSTNVVAKALAQKGCEEGTIILAEQQTAGKGRLGRAWSSPAQQGIWMTVVLRPQFPPQHATGITLLAALAVRRAIASVCGISPTIKWPNDVMLSGGKVCGILTEMHAEMEQIDYVLVGIGINVNTQKEEFPSCLQDIASSILIETGKKIGRNTLIARILHEMKSLYVAYEGQLDAALLAEYYTHSNTIGRRIRVSQVGGEIIGTADGMDSRGALLVTDEKGCKHIVLSGDVSY